MCEELKPCPFCGSAGELIRPMGERVYNDTPPFYGPNWYRVTCSGDKPMKGDVCTGMGQAYEESGPAILFWNTRHSEQEKINV